jgi:YggT family protein
MDVVLVPLLNIVFALIGFYIWILVANVFISWLLAFGVLNRSNRFVYLLTDFIERVTEPALRPIRNFMPNTGGVDLSPMVLILLLWFIEGVLGRLAAKFL